MGLVDLLEATIWSLVWLAPFLAFFLNSRGLPVGGAILAAGLAVCVWRGRLEVAEVTRSGGE